MLLPFLLQCLLVNVTEANLIFKNNIYQTSRNMNMHAFKLNDIMSIIVMHAYNSSGYG